MVVALGVSWWVDNARIEKAVDKLSADRRDWQADFEEKLTMLDEAQQKLRNERWGRVLKPTR